MFDYHRLRRFIVPAIIGAIILCGCAQEQPPDTAPGSTPPDTVPAGTTLCIPSTETTLPQAGTSPSIVPETTVTMPPQETPGATVPVDTPEATSATVPADTPETTAPTVPTDPPETTAPTVPETVPQESAPTEPAVSTFTVTFRDHDGQVLATRQVTAGQDASLPPNPSRSGYVFAGWEGSHRNIKADTVLTATYVSSNAPNLFTIDSSVSGDTVSVTVRLQGNILACGIECHLAYDAGVLQYAGMTKHNNVEANHITLNGQPQIILVWAGSQNMTADTIRDNGTLLELQFRITDPSAADTVLTFLENEMYVDVVDENGSYSSGQFTLTKGVIYLK